MEWSSDGYVLAVGWERGWAIFSVGGRCLASGFGVDDVVDSARFQDAFMDGIKDLVSHLCDSFVCQEAEDGVASFGHPAISSWWCLLNQAQTVSLYPPCALMLKRGFQRTRWSNLHPAICEERDNMPAFPSS